MRAREIVLALVIVLGGVFLYYAKTGRMAWDWDGLDGIFSARGEEFVFEASQAIDEPMPAQVEIRNDHGAVEIEGAGTGPVTILFRKHVWRKDKAAAQTVADALKMIVNRVGDRLVLSTNRDDFKTKKFETDFKLVVPAGTPVLVHNAYGPVKAKGTGPAELINTHGRVSAAAINGGLVLRTSYDDAIVDGIQGDCRIETPHGQVVVQNVQGDLVVESSYGSVRAERAAKKLTISAPHSEVTAKDIRGDCEIGSSYETIRATRTAALKIRGRNSDILLSEIKGAVDVLDDHGTLDAGTIQGSFKVEGKDLRVSARSIDGGETRFRTSYGDVELLDVAGPAFITLSHGDLILRPREPAGPIEVQGSYCAATLEWPAGLRAPFEGRTQSANIDWGLTEKPSLATSNGTSVTKAFPDAAGKPAITIVTTYGDIRVLPAPGGETRRGQ